MVNLLTPYAEVRDANRCELLLELGYNLCCVHRERPSSAEYLQGKGYLEESARLCSCAELAFVPNLRKRESLHARALARLGWAVAAIPGEEHEARTCFRLAHEHEPANPYYLSAMLGFELHFGNHGGLPASMATTIREAVRTCRGARRSLASNCLMPFSPPAASACCWSKGTMRSAIRSRHPLLPQLACIVSRPDVLAEAEHWIRGIHFGVKPPPESQRVIDLLALGREAIRNRCPAASGRFASPVLIIAGGAASLTNPLVEKIRPLLKEACGRFRGTIVSGGTTSGIPGCIGDVAMELAAGNGKQFRLIAYRPASLPDGVTAHPHYDEHVTLGGDFLPEQILRTWSDFLAAGVKPQDVLLLGFGGGSLSAVEYRIALGLGRVGRHRRWHGRCS